MTRARFRAFKCRMGVHRITIGAIPPVRVPGDRNSHRWIIATCCRDCGHLASYRYADGPPRK